MSESIMITDDFGNKFYRNSKNKYHRINGPAIERESAENWWFLNGECLGSNNEGFWALWDKLTPEQKKDPTLLSYLPGGLNV